ncbi:rhomboid family intramembrane serine protease [Flavobacterium croceum]|uniref:rhomboid family intramembrane serine protease n=1 Tax=Flavobacterium croceum TaxID=370975 RepID=UPI0024A7EE91|nr:rhomboid family intramembrane serine protease [Flavobacterium croceum]
MNNITPVVKQLLIINIVFFLGTQFIGNVDFNYKLFSLYYFENPNFRIWQPITSMFMHAQMPNLTHILFNMIALVSFGNVLEHFWGSKRFLFFYISCGLGAALIHTGVNYYVIHNTLHQLSSINFTPQDIQTLLNYSYNPGAVAGEASNILARLHVSQQQFNLLSEAIQSYQTSTVGASGAIYGLLVAFAFMFPNAELAMMFIPIPIKAKYFIPILIGLDLFSGVTGFSVFGAGIAHFAHIGGAVFGFIIMMYWRNNKFNHNRWN